MITAIYVGIWLIGAAIVWRIDENSCKYESPLYPVKDEIKKRIILSIFSWVVIIPFLVMVSIAWIIDRNNV